MLSDTDAVRLDSLCVARDSAESKLIRCFFRLSADARAAASAFLFILDLGAIANIAPSVERRLFHTKFSAHMRGRWNDRNVESCKRLTRRVFVQIEQKIYISSEMPFRAQHNGTYGIHGAIESYERIQGV